MKVVLVEVHAPGDYDSCADCDYAVLSIEDSAAYLTRVCRAAERAGKGIDGFKGIEIWDSHPVVLSRHAALALAGEVKVDKCEDGPVVANVSEKKWDQALQQRERTECVVLHADGDDETFYWSFYPKHTTLECETREIPLALFEYEKSSAR